MKIHRQGLEVFTTVWLSCNGLLAEVRKNQQKPVTAPDCTDSLNLVSESQTCVVVMFCIRM